MFKNQGVKEFDYLSFKKKKRASDVNMTKYVHR